MVVNLRQTRVLLSCAALLLSAPAIAFAQPAEPELPEPAAEPAEGEAAPEEGVAAEASADDAVAAEATAAPAEKAASDDEDIVVTGSRIKRKSKDGAAAPLQVVDRKALEQTGAADMSGLVAKLPANVGADNNAGIGSGSRGQAQFNLRGLGAGNTLVLLNGRRILRTGLTGDGAAYDDVSTIPMSIVERVEIMKGGASAVYGSDAVAGVVNVITRKKYNGLSATVDGNTGTRGDGLRGGKASLTAGVANDTTGLSITASYSVTNAVPGNARDYAYGDPSKPLWPRNQPIPPTGIPAQYAIPTAISSQGNPPSFRLVYPGTDPMTGAPVTQIETRPDPGCAQAPGTYSYLLADKMTPAMGNSPATHSFGGSCGIDFAPYFNYVYPEQRLNVYSTLEHDFTQHLQAFAEFGYQKLDITTNTSPSLSLSAPITVPKDYPDFATVGGDFATVASMTTDSIRVIGRTAGARRGPMHLASRSDNVRLVGGIKGDLNGLAPGSVLDSWNWEASLTYHSEGAALRTTDDVVPNLQRSLNACSPTDANFGKVPCFHLIDYANYGTGVSLNDTVKVGGITAKDYVQGRTFTTILTKMLVFDAFLNGSILPLPGGDLAFAAGGQLQEQATETHTDSYSNWQAYAFNVGVPDWSAKRSIGALYAELAAPLFKGFEVQGALRYERYSDAGSATNPKIGVSYLPFVPFVSPDSPLRGLKLRGSFANSFRGPSLLQSYGTTVAFSQFSVAGSPIFRPQRTYGNPYLTPERSGAIDAGIEFASKFLAFEAEYWQYDYKDLITKENGPGRWADCEKALGTVTGAARRDLANTLMAAGAGPNTVCRGVDLDDQANLNAVNVSFSNGAALKAQGLDFGLNVTYGDPERFGVFSAGTNLVYMMHYKYSAAAGIAAVDYIGSRNAYNFAPPLPKMRGNIPVSWSMAGHRIQLTGNFIGSFTDDANKNVVIPSWFTLDVQYSLHLDHVIGNGTTFAIGAMNVTDRDPPFVQTNLGYEGQAHDPRGRVVYARLTQDF